MIYDSGAAAANVKPWHITGYVFRVNPNVQIAYVSGNFNGAAVALQETALAKADTSDIIIKTTGIANTAAADLISKYLLVESLNDVP
jgi:hypothetical protein